MIAGPWGLLAGAVIIFGIGIPASNAVIRQDGTDDPSKVVVDEVAGQWLALVPAALDPILFLIGFLAFRLFDIWKPWPVGWADRSVHGGLGVMLDDMLAGLFAAGVVILARHVLMGGA